MSKHSSRNSSSDRINVSDNININLTKKKKKKRKRNKNKDTSYTEPTKSSVTRNLFKEEEFIDPVDSTPIIKKKSKKKEKNFG